MNPIATCIKFKVLDLNTRKLITDSSHYNVIVERHNGVATVCLDREDLLPILYTGLQDADGNEIYQDDIVESIVDGERATDVVIWLDGGWRLGGYEGVLSDHVLMHVVGSRHNMPWPVEV